MKNILFLIASIIISSGFSQAQSTLKVKVRDCRQESGFVYLSEFKLFKNDSLLKTVEPKSESTQILKDLEYGLYYIEYVTFFNQTKRISIALTEKKKYKIDLCLDYFDHESDPYQAFIDRLENGEFYRIEFMSSGCFHGTRDTLLIERKADQYYLSYQGQDRLLNQDEIGAIRNFEKELNYSNPSYGCTTVDSYELRYRSEKLIKMDGGCRWKGGLRLKMALSLNAE